MNKSLEYMVKKIESYDKEEQIHILKIILKDNHVSYSENNNGTFIKLDLLNPEIINELNEYIKYTEQKEKDIDSVEQKMNEMKKDLNI